MFKKLDKRTLARLTNIKKAREDFLNRRLRRVTAATMIIPVTTMAQLVGGS